MAELILGGARSGKSALAEARAAAGGLAIVYIATGEAGDGEMSARIAHHRARRPAAWTTIETPLALAETLRREASPGRLLLVDCLTLWLTNLLFSGLPQDGSVDEARFDTEIAALLAALPNLPGRVLLVSNEVGCGIVPLNAMARRFADEQGRLNQRVAALCTRVTLVAAGLPLELKGSDRSI